MTRFSAWLIDSPDGDLALAPLFLGKVTLLLAAAWLLHAALRGSNPRWRVVVWRTAALGSLLLAGLALLPPGMSCAVLPPAEISLPSGDPALAQEDRAPDGARDESATASDERQRTFERGPMEGTSGRDVATRWSSGSPVGEAPNTSSARIADVEARRSLSSFPEPDTTPIAGRSDSAPAAIDTPLSPAAWLVVIWSVGCLVGLSRTAIGLSRLRAIRRRSTPVPASTAERACEVAVALEVARPFELRRTAELQSPCLVGLANPLILIPAAQCEAAREEELAPILGHELAHLKGEDALWNALLHAVSLVLWFHPLMWRVRARHADACDAVCDALAADYVGDAVRYGRTLARIALRITGPELSAGLAMARKSSVQRRIEALRRKVFRTGLSRRKRLIAVTAATMTILALGSISLTRSQAEPQSPAPSAKPDAKKEGPAAAAPEEAKKPEDKPAMSQLVVRCLDAASGEPLANVEFRFHGFIGNGFINVFLQSDAEGVARFEWKADATVHNLRTTARATNHVPLHYSWRSDEREIELPKTLELHFEPGTTIGGRVDDEAGKPIAGATVQVMMPITWPKIDNYVFTTDLTTDANGRWEWDCAPADLSSVSVGGQHADYISAGGAAVRGKDQVIVLKQGPQVVGSVVDSQGKPIAGADVHLGFDRFGTNEPKTTTDENGRFVLKNCNPGKSIVTVQAEGFAPTFQEVTVGEDKGLAFELAPGKTLRVRVLDRDGKPIAGALVAPNTWRGFRSLEKRLNTDAAGEVVWNSAPPDVMLCDVLQQGYMSVRRTPLQAKDEFQTVTLLSELRISGRVTDARTGKPIEKFRIVDGLQLDNVRDTYWEDRNPTPYQGGQYTRRYGEPQKRVLKVIADGYVSVTSRLFEPNEQSQTFDFSLEPATGPAATPLTGIVLHPDGRPAQGADVALATPERRLRISSTGIGRNNRTLTARTDAEGRFSFSPQAKEENFVLFVIHDAGFAEVARFDFAETSPIRLAPWGRIEGRVFVGDQPDGGQNLAFHPHFEGSRRSRWIDHEYYVQADEAGRFVIDRVTPGDGWVVRSLNTTYPGGSSLHTFCWNTPVEVRGGETTQVTVGGTGRPVAGRAVLDRQPESPVDWTLSEPVSISRRHKPGDKWPELRRYCGNLLKSGRFRIPDVPPGDYTVHVTAHGPYQGQRVGPGDPIGRGTFDFTVPDIPGNRSDEPLDLGDITVKLFESLAVGAFAPEFVTERLDGGPLGLADYRGKLLVLNFWTNQNRLSVAWLTTLKGLHEQFEKNPRFALVSICSADGPEIARRVVAENGLGWDHAAVAGLHTHVPKSYAVREVPALFVIGPDGRILKRNPSLEELRQFVAATLADDKVFAAAANIVRPPRFPVTRFTGSAAPPKLLPEPALVVLGDTDESSAKNVPHSDRLRVLSASGAEVWSRADMNSFGGSRDLAVNWRPGRIFVSESGAERLIAFDLQGERLWEVGGIAASVVAVDEKTGYVWCSGGALLNDGETHVFGAAGKLIASWPYRAIDMAYDPRDEAFWLVGYEILKLSRDGTVLFRKKAEGWSCSSVAVNSDGSVWIAERDHPDVAGSKNRVWLLNADGSIRRRIELGDYGIFSLAANPRTGDAWICGHNGGLKRFPLAGEPADPLDIPARNVAISPTTGDIWVTTREEVLRLDPTGKVQARSKFHKPTWQASLAAF